MALSSRNLYKFLKAPQLPTSAKTEYESLLLWSCRFTLLGNSHSFELKIQKLSLKLLPSLKLISTIFVKDLMIPLFTTQMHLSSHLCLYFSC